MDVIRSREFDEWLRNLRDPLGTARIVQRLVRLADGNAGDVKPVGGGISELRVDTGPGYRIYLMRAGGVTVVLLCGGDKSTQAKDIARARQIALAWKGNRQI